jgi:hypothetical protein
LRGDGSELVGGRIARSSLPESGRNKRQDYNFLCGAYLLSTCLHETYRDLIIKSAKAAFSRREHDILCWGAEGKNKRRNQHHTEYLHEHRSVSLEEYFEENRGERPHLCDR